MSPQPKITTETVDGTSRFLCGQTTDGVDWHAAGCDHPTPRAALDHTEVLYVIDVILDQVWDDLP